MLAWFLLIVAMIMILFHLNTCMMYLKRTFMIAKSAGNLTLYDKFPYHKRKAWIQFLGYNNNCPKHAGIHQGTKKDPKTSIFNVSRQYLILKLY